MRKMLINAPAKETNKMKKLMIAAAIVCVAAVSQAASADWSWATNTGVLKDGYNKSAGLKGSSYSPVAMPNATTYLFLAGVATPDTGKEGTITTLPGPSTNLKDDTLKGSWTAGGWYKVQAAPEPTSGLLLLLGVAGLALKRRRA